MLCTGPYRGSVAEVPSVATPVGLLCIGVAGSVGVQPSSSCHQNSYRRDTHCVLATNADVVCLSR